MVITAVLLQEPHNVGVSLRIGGIGILHTLLYQNLSLSRRALTMYERTAIEHRLNALYQGTIWTHSDISTLATGKGEKQDVHHHVRFVVSCTLYVRDSWRVVYSEVTIRRPFSLASAAI
jgi:hypothetical protein